MAKLTLTDIATTINTTSSVNSINANNALIETALENTLSRDGTSPNTMGANLDMNSNKIVNLATPTANSDAATKAYADSLTTGVAGADGSDGWSPILAVISDGERRVLQLTDWTGGEGTEPASGTYLGASGLTAVIGDAVNIRGATGTSGAGTGDLLAANNLSDIGSATTARTNLGLAIGTNVQAWDQQLQDIAALAVTDGNFIVGNGTTFVAENGSTARTSLGLAIGTNVQAWDADLDAIAALAKTDGNFIVGDGSTWVAESGSTVRTSLGLGTAATLDVGTTASKVVQLNGSAQLPAVDGSLLTNLASSTGVLKGLQIFSASGTYTRTSGATKAIVIATGGGGGGGDGGSSSEGPGGGSGETRIAFVTLGSTETVTIGAGGAAELAGGNTSFGAHVTANGGSGGTGISGGARGTGGSGGTSLLGQNGQDGHSGTGVEDVGWGIGGGSFWGGGGMSSAEAGQAYGSGGAGRSDIGTAGAGKGGLVVVFEFA